ncbi:MAG TPA: hypothetical protein DCS23_03230 [Candidatus Yonathbacteria bacterium]|nr:hypothetical protein [Candidatus Yonathbacteria bacterium]
MLSDLLLFLLRGGSIPIGISHSRTKENDMKSNLPLSLMDVVGLICDEKNGLAIKLHKEIAYRNASADHSDMHCCKTLASDTKVVRIRQEIGDVVRRGVLQCEYCKEDSTLGSWRLVDRETLLKCPKCIGLTPLAKSSEWFVLEDLLPLVPVPLRDIFAPEE